MTVSCQWKQCRMVCEQSSLLRHLERHIEKETTCIYDDCDERFSRVQDLEAHEKSEHANDEPPPCAIPRPPELKPLPVLPQTLPSYTTTTRLASKPSITEDRHARLGPWVLGKTFGYPTLGPDGELFDSASRVRRATRLADKAIDMVPMPTFPGLGESGEMTPNSEFLGQSAEYDLLEEPTVATTRIFRDLDTVDVTQLFCDGGNIVRGSSRGPVSDGTSEGDGSSQTGMDTDCLAVEALL
ncbi:hypothetical protein BJV78DRAFT_484809 [Lactifluus subvellereus]|nr:hypothetical protein BJV78DRAFT_484809 [Lactifluus subvellereus]